MTNRKKTPIENTDFNNFVKDIKLQTMFREIDIVVCKEKLLGLLSE